MSSVLFWLLNSALGWACGYAFACAVGHYLPRLFGRVLDWFDDKFTNPFL